MLMLRPKDHFDVKAFLANIGQGRKIVHVRKKNGVYAQGDPSDAVFYIKKGRIRLTVLSKNGKEATIAILNAADFFGEGCLAGQLLRMGSATAMTDCELMRIENKAMQSALHRERALSDMFVAYLLARNIRYEEDLVDQLFNSSEKRLAPILLLLARFGKEWEARGGNSQDQSGNPCRNGRHNALSCQLLYESIQKVVLHSLQW